MGFITEEESAVVSSCLVSFFELDDPLEGSHNGHLFASSESSGTETTSLNVA